VQLGPPRHEASSTDICSTHPAACIGQWHCCDVFFQECDLRIGTDALTMWEERRLCRQTGLDVGLVASSLIKCLSRLLGGRGVVQATLPLPTQPRHVVDGVAKA
jgi:hypothetical protein